MTNEPGTQGGRDGLLDRWVDFALKHTKLLMVIGTLLFALAGFFAAKLGLRSDFVELLPTDSPSVMNLERLKTRIASYATLTVAVQSPDLAANQKFAEDLVPLLRAMPENQVKYVDYSINELTEFYKKNKYLYGDLQDLVDFRDRLKKRIQEETEGAVVESLDDEPAPKTDLKIDELRAKYEKKAKEADRYPGGYYVTPDKKLLAIFVRPPSTHDGFEASDRLVKDVQVLVDQLDPKKYHPEMTVGFTGDVKSGLEERDALAADMGFIGILSLFLILGIIILYYRSLRAVILVGLPMLLGLATAFAVAFFAVGYLNSATAFLTSIIAGNGINFMIMLSARFYEEIRNEGPDGLEKALKASVHGTIRGTAVAGAAAAIAYGSLIIAGFRGFRQFGIIGGVGMAACWIATFAFGPAIIAFVHRIKPLGTMRATSGKQPIATFVGRLVTNHSRAILFGSLVLTALSVLALIIPFGGLGGERDRHHYAPNSYLFDPFEYDFRNLRNKEGYKRGSAKLSNEVDKIFELPQNPTPCVTDDLTAVTRIKEKLLNAPNARSTIGDVKTIFDLLPKQQEQKIPVLADIREMIDRKIDFLSEKDRKEILDNRPADDLHVLGPDDVPGAISRQFTESDGTRGRIFYIYSHPKESLLDGKYLLRFADFIRNTDLGADSMTAVGQAMVFADMVAAIERDGVRVTFASFLAVVLLLFVAYRSRLGILTILASVLLGTLWMIGFAALFDLKLNFLNFVVIPITLGISVDYGANIFSRYRIEGPGRMVEVLKSTGGAVVLASGTTILGYATLITSTNMALQSFGLIADIGEFTCLATAELTMTALIVWIEQNRSRRKA